MKKALIMLLCAALALSLAACGEPATDPNTASPEPVVEPSEPAAEVNESEPPAENTESGESLLEIAKTFEDAPLDELIAAIGEPVSRDYAPSCLGDGEDGNLYYDGFTVYTYRDTDGEETVNYVE